MTYYQSLKLIIIINILIPTYLTIMLLRTGIIKKMNIPFKLTKGKYLTRCIQTETLNQFDSSVEIENISKHQKPYRRTTTASTTISTKTINPALPQININKFAPKILTTEVRDIEHARSLLKRMKDYNDKHPETVWACDTEVADIDVKKVGPVGNGHVVCVSVYGGDEIDYGEGHVGTALWIENIDQREGLLMEFKNFFESSQYKKAWHNYGFDRHVMENEGIVCGGFAGDTMHMARMWDTSRDKVNEGGAGYSLESLSTSLLSSPDLPFTVQKTSMKDLFGIPKQKKDGTESKVKEIPDIYELQRSNLYRSTWIEYSAKDAIATYWLRHELEKRLKQQPWKVNEQVIGTMYDFYMKYVVDFGQLLTDMEANGIRVDTKGHLKVAEAKARQERDELEKQFKEWAAEHCDDAKYINIGSSSQIQQFLFGEYENREFLYSERVFKIDKSEEEYERELASVLQLNPYIMLDASELKLKLKERGLKSGGKKPDGMIRLLGYDEYHRLLGQTAEELREELRKVDPTASLLTIEGERGEEEGWKRSVALALLHHKGYRLFASEQKILEEKSSAMKKASSVPSKADSEGQAGEGEGGLDYFRSTVAVLKERMKRLGLKTSGNKSVLIKALLQHELKDALDGMSTMDLHETCCQRGREVLDLDVEAILRGGDAQAVETLRSGLIQEYIETEYDRLVLMKSTATVIEPSPTTPSELEESDSLSSSVPPMMVQEAPKKYREIVIKSLRMTPTELTPGGLPQVSTAVLKKLAGKNLDGDDSEAVWGTAYQYFGGGEEGKRACRAIGALAKIGQIDATITNFLVPLQALVDKKSRIHCSLNLNTETGRLSSRRPNLQNQPALEKDTYKIRDAFIAEEGKTLIVADYGQLELRLLAHISRCRSMIDAFASGGCFHSRTAVGMYPYIKEAVESGQVLLEWDYSKGQPTVPLVKDTYGSERRKAKTLNFSIAYGKTVHGLAQDWGISKEEAEKTLEAWYRDRPEVKQWQEKTREGARRDKFVTTLMGRYRILHDAGENGSAGGHALRAAINTPIQGSAADVVMMAMIKLWKNEALARMGWRLLLQIHDEVILEGPKETKTEALQIVRECMENPYDSIGLHPLLVHLDVDAKSADSWYKAK